MLKTVWTSQNLKPREKLQQHGANTLSDAELLSILLRTGYKGTHVTQLAQQLLTRFGGLPKLMRTKFKDLASITGIGPSKAAQLCACIELVKKMLATELHHGTCLSSSESVKSYLKLHLGHQPHEILWMLCLDTQNRLLKQEEMSRGTLRSTAVYTRELIKTALAHNAAAVIISHNHPCGEAKPSNDDYTVTQNLAHAFSLVDIRLIDHFIVADNQILSFAEAGLMPTQHLHRSN